MALWGAVNIALPWTIQPMNGARCRRSLRDMALVALGLALYPGATLYAQPKTDVVTFANGDRITGEVKQLDRGRLEFSTDDAGTLYLEWDKLVSVVATRIVEVVTSDGRRFLGSLGTAGSRDRSRLSLLVERSRC